MRTRLVATCLLLLVGAAVASALALRALLVVRLEDRIDATLERELREVALVAGGVDPATGRPFTSVDRVFDVHLSRDVPDDEEGMLALVEGRVYRSNLAHFPVGEVGALPPEMIDVWERHSVTGSRVDSTSDSFDTPVGPAHFRVGTIAIDGQDGAFVVMILPEGELRAIDEIQRYGILVILAVLLVASGAARLVVGRVLGPVRQLAATARSISWSNLTTRVEEVGSDEAAEMARSFNSMLERLDHAAREQRRFAEDAGHALCDPITICRGHLEMLGPVTGGQRDTVDLVIDELDRMARTVNDLQLLVDADRPDLLQPEPIDLRSFTHELAAKASALAPRDWRLDAVADGTLVADRHRLTEAVMNLARNAAHHTEPGQTVAIGSAVDGAHAHLWVRDTGCGVLASDRARIFDRFARGRGAHRLYRGTGLGLAIVHSIAVAHDGRAEIESDLGAGATFRIVLPLDPAARGDGWPGS